jgi:YrbI family 3-deoxy-D-manno-octulosonate 8-phosphate phosphatase
MKKAIAIIPARCGSKSIKLKNIKLFCGKPLIYWALTALSNSKYIEEIYVATDCDKIENAVVNLNIQKVKIYRRLTENATNEASTESLMLEFIDKNAINQETQLILVQATSPLLQTQNIDKAFKKYYKGNFDSVISVVRLKRFFWNENGQALNYDYKNRPRRQDFEGILMENGAFYINIVKNILKYKNRLSGKILTFEMPEYSAIEIDEEDDWLIAESIMRKNILNKPKDKSFIKLFLTDVDGVLTDAGMYYSERGDEFKKFNTHDGMAFELLRNAGIKTGIITSENTNLVARRSEKLKVDFLYQGKKGKNKLEVVKEICKNLNISLNDVAYIGDDVNCFEILTHVGFVACPSDAVNRIKSIPNINIMNMKGGEGCVREFVELIFLLNKIVY